MITMGYLNKLLRYFNPFKIGEYVSGGKFTWLKFSANGMLGPSIYRKIHDYLISTPDYPFIEIGAASGAGTIAMAWAYNESHKKSKIVAIEKCEGGSRSKYGNYNSNLEILVSNFKKFKVEDRVILFTKKLDKETVAGVFQSINDSPIGGFMHDADGRLDRDFLLFWERTIDGGLIIVDDCPKDPDIDALIRRRGKAGRKDYVAARAWECILRQGLVENCWWYGKTVFAYKPKNSGLINFSYDELHAVTNAAEKQYLELLNNDKNHNI